VPAQPFERIFREASPELTERLRAFRKAHPVERLTSEVEARVGGGWEYVVGGEGDETILFIHGLGATGESHFLQVSALEEDFRVLAPTIPGAPTMRALADGLTASLEAVGVNRAHLFGVSFGGLVAQAFLHHHPDRVADVVLSHTMVPRASAAKDVINRQRVTRLLPVPLYGWLARVAGIKAFKNDVPDLTPGELSFWKAYFIELYPYVVTKAMALGRLMAGADFMLDYELTRGGPNGWSGRVLIVESESDSFVPKDDREALKDHYREADVHTITGYGHCGALARADTYVDPVRRFLKRCADSDRTGPPVHVRADESTNPAEG
jgi:pimeloyl-ACP methyl ester carboxylesterase